MVRASTSITKSVATVGLSLMAACMPSADDNCVRPIVGTEQLAVEKFCITVSPDERWLTFVEWRLSDKERAKNGTMSGYATRVTSLELRTGALTRHSIDGLSAEVLGFPPERKDWRLSAGHRIIKERFRSPGWIRGLFYFQRYGRNTYLALDPTQPDIRIVDTPDTAGTCSDCPPGIAADFRGRTWDLLSNDVSAVLRDGVVRAVYYWEGGANGVNAIVRIGENGGEELVVDRRQKQFALVTITALRVSPDERYLAYVVRSKPRELLSGPREELAIRDLQSKEEKQIASHGSVGNLIWSPRGERLYFAGGSVGGDGTAYVVDVGMAFGE
jgi:hypothetical protein